MKFIEFATPSGTAYSINPDFVSAVVPSTKGGLELGCLIYVAGDSDPFQTQELYADVMAKLNGSTKGNEAAPETAPRFTGLTDRDSKNIFEGDILRMQDSLGVVIWNDKIGAWRSKDIRRGLGEMHPAFFHLSKVVGNIHDNPELLEVMK